MLAPFATDIWLSPGPIVAVASFRYPTRMAVIRLAEGGLFLWSPVVLTPELRAAIDALGPVRAIVTPTALHDLFLAEWKRAYPHAQLFAAPGSRKRAAIPFDADLTDNPPALWAGELDQVPMPNAIATEIVFFHRASKTILFADLIQHFPRDWFKGWRALVARLDGMTAPEPAVPQKFRLAFTDRPAARAGLAKIQAWPAERILAAHAPPITENTIGFLARAFQWLR